LLSAVAGVINCRSKSSVLPGCHLQPDSYGQSLELKDSVGQVFRRVFQLRGMVLLWYSSLDNTAEYGIKGLIIIIIIPSSHSIKGLALEVAARLDSDGRV
jgi:hypothetical protein